MQVHPSSYSSYTYAEAYQNQVQHLIYSKNPIAIGVQLPRGNVIPVCLKIVSQIDLRGIVTHPLIGPGT